MRFRAAIIALALADVSCQTPPSPPARTPDFEALSREFAYGALALSPVASTGAGYHQHNGVRLDERLDDYSAAGLDGQRRFYSDIQGRIDAINPASLDTEQQADLEIIRNSVALARLELDTIQSYKHNPTVYVELAGNALFN